MKIGFHTGLGVVGMEVGKKILMRMAFLAKD